MSAGSSPWFIVYDDETPIKYKEGRLVRAIKAGELDGDELFRREDEAETALRPLHHSLLFQQVHGVDSLGAARIVDVNKVGSFSQHFTWFLAVNLGLNLIGVNTSWAVFWAIGLAFHFGKIAPSFNRLLKERGDSGFPAILGVLYGMGERSTPGLEASPDKSVGGVEVGSGARTPREETFAWAPRRDEAPEPPLHGELRVELERLEPLRDALDDAGRRALDDTRRALGELFERRRRIAAHLHDEDEEQLLREAAEIEDEWVSPGLDAQTREVLEQTVLAVQQRQESLAGARRVDTRLRARASSALHQLKSLRLSLVSSTGDVDHEIAAPLGAVVDALRAEMAGAEELEETLVEARRPARPRRIRIRQ